MIYEEGPIYVLASFGCQLTLWLPRSSQIDFKISDMAKMAVWSGISLSVKTKQYFKGLIFFLSDEYGIS